MSEHSNKERDKSSSTDGSSPIFGTHRERVAAASNLFSARPAQQHSQAATSPEEQDETETITEQDESKDQEISTTDGSSPIFGTHRERVWAGKLWNGLPAQQSYQANETSPAADDTAIQDVSDNESDLSDLGATPPPPNSELRTIEISHDRREVQCTHTQWCDCPMHASHASSKQFAHLSEWALSSMQLHESSERSTNRIQQARQMKRNEANRWSRWCVDALTAMRVAGEEDAFHDRAFKLVAKINDNFDVNLIPEDHVSRIQAVGEALSQWKRDMDYDKLDREFCNLVLWKRDLIFEFQKFLPHRLRKVSVDDTGVDVRTSHLLKTVEMLETARTLDDAPL